MIYLYLFGTCFHFIYVFMIIGKYHLAVVYTLQFPVIKFIHNFINKILPIIFFSITATFSETKITKIYCLADDFFQKLHCNKKNICLKIQQ